MNQWIFLATGPTAMVDCQEYFQPAIADWQQFPRSIPASLMSQKILKEEME